MAGYNCAGRLTFLGIRFDQRPILVKIRPFQLNMVTKEIHYASANQTSNDALIYLDGTVDPIPSVSDCGIPRLAITP